MPPFGPCEGDVARQNASDRAEGWALPVRVAHANGPIRGRLRSGTMVLEEIERGRSDRRRGSLRLGPSGGPGASLGEPGDGEDLGRARPGGEPGMADRSSDRLDP